MIVEMLVVPNDLAGIGVEGERRAYREAHPADSWVDFSAGVRCILGFNAGTPMTPSAYNNNMQLFQTPGHVVIVTEMAHTARVVPLDGRPHLSSDIRQWSGDSRGYWEGETLVIETSNFAEKRRWRGTTESAHLGRAPDTPGRRHARLRVHGDRSEDLDEAVDRVGDDGAEPGTDV